MEQLKEEITALIDKMKSLGGRAEESICKMIEEYDRHAGANKNANVKKKDNLDDIKQVVLLSGAVPSVAYDTVATSS